LINLELHILSYNYNIASNNKIRYVSDAVVNNVNTPVAQDILSQAANNYRYYAIGNLTQDIKEGIPEGGIKWDVAGKVESITTSGTKMVIFSCFSNAITLTIPKVTKTTVMYGTSNCRLLSYFLCLIVKLLSNY